MLWKRYFLSKNGVILGYYLYILNFRGKIPLKFRIEHQKNPQKNNQTQWRIGFAKKFPQGVWGNLQQKPQGSSVHFFVDRYTPEKRTELGGHRTWRRRFSPNLETTNFLRRFPCWRMGWVLPTSIPPNCVANNWTLFEGTMTIKSEPEAVKFVTSQRLWVTRHLRSLIFVSFDKLSSKGEIKNRSTTQMLHLFFAYSPDDQSRAGQATSQNTSCEALKLTYKKGTRTLPSEVAPPARNSTSEPEESEWTKRPTTPEGRKASPSSTQELHL